MSCTHSPTCLMRSSVVQSESSATEEAADGPPRCQGGKLLEWESIVVDAHSPTTFSNSTDVRCMIRVYLPLSHCDEDSAAGVFVKISFGIPSSLLYRPVTAMSALQSSSCSSLVPRRVHPRLNIFEHQRRSSAAPITATAGYENGLTPSNMTSKPTTFPIALLRQSLLQKVGKKEVKFVRSECRKGFAYVTHVCISNFVKFQVVVSQYWFPCKFRLSVLFARL